MDRPVAIACSRAANGNFSAHGSLDQLPNPSEDCAFGFKPLEPVAMTTKLDKYHRIAGFYDALDWPFETAIYSRARPRVFAGLSGRILDAGVVELVVQAVREGTTATKRGGP